MKKLFLFFILVLSFAFLVGCEKPTEETEEDIFQLLMEAEDLSGMKTNTIITKDGSLNLPTEYKGVQISYKSRNTAIITDDGIVTRPGECWLESRDQQGEEVFENLNDNWPVVLDVILTYKGQTRKAKIMFVVAPRENFTCDKYQGNKED